MPDTNDLHRLGFKLKFVYSMTGLLLGLACIVAGVVLGLSGVAGHTSWTASALGLSTSMTDAAPGVIIFVVGIFFVWMTRFKVRQVTQHPPTESRDSAPPPESEPEESRTSSSDRSSLRGRTVLDYHTDQKF